ncbi:MAG: DUF192 domain-containing protein, partial [Candidatus Hydrothermarchaeales archaeon]
GGFMRYEIRVRKNGNIVCHCNIAKSFFSRGLGLMFKWAMPKDEGLLIEFPSWSSSRAVHGFFMRFPIDLIFIDKDLKVVDVGILKPWRLYNPKVNCKWVSEVNQGIAEDKDVRVGDELEFKEIE